MPLRSIKRAAWLLLAGLVVAAPVSWVSGWRLFELADFKWQQWRNAQQGQQQSALWLPDYQVEIEALPLPGLRNVSALTYDPDRRSLFSVTNKNAELLELSLDGKVLQRIPLTGFGDAEAVEYISHGIYVISDEKRQRLFRVHVDENTRWLDADESEQLALEDGPQGNKGFEGLAYDPAGKRLFIAKERDPLRILSVEGFPRDGYGPPVEVKVEDDPQRDSRLFVRDLSALQFDPRSGHLLALSDESKMILELDLAGKPVSSMLLWRGMHGLTRSVPQAEGLALDEQGVLYLVSEPNLFYRFAKPGLEN